MSYFWLPCPICGEMFSGHESGDVTVPTPLSTNEKLACRRHTYGRSW